MKQPMYRLTVAYWTMLAFIFSIPWEDTVDVPILGRISRALGVVSAIVWLVTVIARGGMRKPHLFHGVFGLFLAWIGLSLFWTIDPVVSTAGFITFIQLFVMLLILWDVFRTRATVETALQAYVAGAWVSAIGLIRVYVAVGGSTTGLERYTIGGFEVNGISLLLALAIPAAWYLAFEAGGLQKRVLVRLANLAYLPAAAFAMVLTGTRGAVVASIPSAVFVLWSIWRQPRRARLVQVGAVGAAVILVATLAPPELLSRIGSAATEFSGAGDRAEVIWSRSLDVFWDHPVVGVGFNAHRAAVPLGFHITRGVAHSSLAKEAHNTPISILVETGIIGFAIFVALAVTLLRAVSVLPRPQVRYWVTQLAVISVGAQTLSLEESKAVWFFFGIAIAATAAGYSRAAENGREPARSWAPAQL